MSAPDWSIRLARPADAPALPAIERSAAQSFADDPELAFLADTDTIDEERHRRLIARGHCLVAECSGEPVGFLAAEPERRELHIVEMSVRAGYQRRGIGDGLVRACLIDARNAEFRAVTLTTFADVAWNAPFYARLGFETVENLAAHPRLAAILDEEAKHGLPRERRLAMIRFLEN